jgi:sucrose-6-phosphate hydrolase SacC (GH32 family)
MRRAALSLMLAMFFAGSDRMRVAAAADDRAGDIVIADFEGPDYGDWTTTGEAFGTGPAKGALDNQMPVSGFLGHGLVNSYHKGDASTGTLTSPKLRIERKYINFLIGGGNHPHETCINLLSDGKVVRTETGADSEVLEWATWDVGDLAGKEVQLEIVDRNTQGWGHILIDQILQSAERKAEAAEDVPLYQESLRPQFHFTSRTNWLNDPNGLVFYRGEYHLFFQHNPAGINWGNMTWGHAVSTDLLHWKQLDDAIAPDRLGTIFSGSAVIDWHNTAALQTGEEKPLVAIYTSAGGTSPASNGQPFTQSIAASNDRGRTFRKYDHNPVLGHIIGGNRDPKVIWHGPSKKWVMALYLDGDQYALFSSPDLKQWKKLCDIPRFGSGECPDIFELPIEGVQGKSRWIFWGGNNTYLIGDFDGTKFVNESGPHRFEFGANYYAAQTYSDIPAADGRRIQIGWMSGGKYPRMPFNQQMSFPGELVLRQTSAGLRLCKQPVRELDSLHGEKFAWSGTLKQGDNPLAAVKGDLFHVRMDVEPAAAGHVSFSIRGAKLDYDPQRGELSLRGKTAVVTPRAAKLKLQILIDRSSIEVFADGGRIVMSSCFSPIPSKNTKDAPLLLDGNGAKLDALDVWPLATCWK